MSDRLFEFKSHVLGKLRADADHHKNSFNVTPKLFQKPLDCSYDELNSSVSNSSGNVRSYAVGLFALKIYTEPHDPAQDHEYFSFFLNEFGSNSETLNALISDISTDLLNMISSAKSEQLNKWAEILLKLKEREDLIIVIKWLKMALIRQSFALFKKVLENNTNENNVILLVSLIYLMELDRDQVETVNTFCRSVLSNTLLQVQEEMNRNHSVSPELGSKISSIKKHFNQENANILREIEAITGPFVFIRSSKKEKRVFSPENLISHINFDKNLVSFDHHRDLIITNVIPGKYSVSVYRCNYSPGGTVILKCYYGFNPSFDRSTINSEINIISFLSNRSTERPMFLKVYYYEYANDCIYIYMEDGGDNLMTYITEIKKTNQTIPLEKIEKWIIDLLENFAWLACNRIYHRDIKPHNIIVSPDKKNLRIIDFSISKELDDIDRTNSFSVLLPLQGTNGYLAPELQEAWDIGIKDLKYKPGKSDVFSLGLTIVQMITLEKLTGLNTKEKNNELQEKVNSLNCKGWIKRLLRFMLEKERNKRPSINKCVSFIEREGVTGGN